MSKEKKIKKYSEGVPKGKENKNKNEIEIKPKSTIPVQRYKKRDMILNLPKTEYRGLKSLKKRIANGEIVISQTDKSGRFAVLSLKQYLDSGRIHTDKDEEIDWQKVNYLQGQVNNHVWWISRILGNALKTDQQKMGKNMQATSLEIPDMILLLKDHKQWSEDSGTPVPSRPVVSGNKGINSHLSELLAEIMEPLSNNNVGVEICSTEEALCKVEELNDVLESGASVQDINVLNLLTEREEKRFIKRCENSIRNDACTDLETERGIFSNKLEQHAYE